MAATYRQYPVWSAPFLPPTVIPVTDEARREEWMRALGATILALRVERGPALGIYTQGELGTAVGTSAATVLRWENGRGAPPDAWEIKRLCEIFSLESDDLLKPEAMTDRERQVLRRAGRQLRRSIDQSHEDDQAPS